MTTRAPFESVHSVTPISSIRRSSTTLPGSGSTEISGLSTVVSTYGRSQVVSPRSIAARSWSSEGSCTPGLSGAVTRTTRSSSSSHSCPTRLTSSSSIPGMNRWYSAHS